MAELADVLRELEADPDFSANVTHWEHLPARDGRFSDFPGDLDPRVTEILENRGIRKLYTHQEQCYRNVRAGRDVVVVTPTASGKTLCYNLPVLQTLLERKEARALYMFPTKALSQDQQSELNEVILGGRIPVKVSTYDGDTPSSLRVAARESGRIVITNPDMLHSGILPNHPKWIRFMSSLAFIVIDEVHIYRGVFGSHLTNLVRRLKRVVRFYGADPVFICCSATIGNPLELTRRIIEKDPVLVDENGSPSGEKHVILYNPPLVDRVQGIRRGVVNEAQKLALMFLKRGVKTIVFSRSRVRTELIASYINSSLANVYNDNNRIRVEPYRGGYLPSERRSIEKGLRDGAIQGVVSTNALELGIDIGGLDASILAGFPGSIASSWQQAGRSGRRNSVSVAVLIASASPTDQYMIRHPEYFFGRSPESGWVDPDNIYILLDHLKCAVFELPFSRGEDFGGETETLLEHLEEGGTIRLSDGTWYWSDRSYPAEQISLRSATSENVVIIDATRGRNEVIGEMDRVSAKELLFEGAVYIHRGDQFIVETLDIENKRCFVQETDLNYFTDSIVKKDIKVLHEDSRSEESGTGVLLGDVLVRTQVAKFKKLKYHTHENVGYGDISLPEEEIHTRAVTLIFEPGTAAGDSFLAVPKEAREDVIARIGTLVKNVAPVFLLCDPRDIGIAERLRDPHTGEPSLYIYDVYPGGTGISEGFLSNVRTILEASRDLLASCPCVNGCPSCIGPDTEQGAGVENKKEAVARFLGGWLDGDGR